MDKNYYHDKSFKGTDFLKNKLIKADYENCIFNNCVFSNSDLSGTDFIDCEFNNCDLSMVKSINTAFRNIKFKECKLLGVHFEDCNDFLFSVNFKACQLNLSSFYKRNLKKVKFIDCLIHEVDFTEANLSGASFLNCDLAGAIFKNSVLENVDFRTSYNFSINPENNRIEKAKFSLSGVVGLLDDYNIEIE
ncbi:MAG: pentapeptide repeat-containing protein [Bacteroidetes bacterium]|nr:MAG: pentapeptide repeat-containing protein [Bacteroidota bacterium]